jgi:hypothetical protein
MTAEKSPSNIRATELTFADTEDFYAQLKEAMSSGMDVVIDTPFTAEREVPERLAEAIDLRQALSSLIGDMSAFVVGAEVSYAIAPSNMSFWRRLVEFFLRVWRRIKRHVRVKVRVRPDGTLEEILSIAVDDGTAVTRPLP